MLMLKKMGSKLRNHSAIVTQTAEVLSFPSASTSRQRVRISGGTTSYFIAGRMERSSASPSDREQPCHGTLPWLIRVGAATKRKIVPGPQGMTLLMLSDRPDSK